MTGGARRLLFLVERLSSDGGAGRAIERLAGALRAAGRDPELLLPRQLAGGPSRWKRPGDLAVAFHAAPGADLYYPHGGSWTAWERRNADSAAGPYRWLQRARTRLSIRQRRFARAEARLCADRRVRILAISRLVARDFERDHGVESARLSVVHNGVDTDAYRPDAALRASERARRGWDGAFVCLFAAHNFRLKGLAPFIGLAAASRAQDLRWIVAGKGDVRAYRAAARRLGCAGRVAFLGGAPDLRPLYAAADVLVQPTFYDPCSLTTLEALASGLPVLTTSWNGAGEIVAAGGGGRVVEDPRDIPRLAAALDEIRAAGEPLRGRARAAAEGRAEARWAGEVAKVIEGLDAG